KEPENVDCVRKEKTQEIWLEDDEIENSISCKESSSEEEENMVKDGPEIIDLADDDEEKEDFVKKEINEETFLKDDGMKNNGASCSKANPVKKAPRKCPRRNAKNKTTKNKAGLARKQMDFRTVLRSAIEKTPGISDPISLESFLLIVKSKRHPNKIARKFVKNVNNLIKQLTAIEDSFQKEIINYPPLYKEYFNWLCKLTRRMKEHKYKKCEICYP
ncbi:unnamed protein product, partial [Larinioides sclopetarius]